MQETKLFYTIRHGRSRRNIIFCDKNRQTHSNFAELCCMCVYLFDKEAQLPTAGGLDKAKLCGVKINSSTPRDNK